jgi:undecaprenyl-diphosphatase
MIRLDIAVLGLLALVEGVANILPIDSSAHGLLASRLLGWRAGPLDAALHLALVLALMLYFWRDMLLIASGLLKLGKMRIEPGTRLLAKMLLAAAPLGLIAAGVGGINPPVPSDLLAVGLITLVAALAMLFADRLSLTVKRIDHIGIGTTLALGLLQLLSLLPGVGRLSMALTVTRLFGMERKEAYRFALLVSLPVLLAQSGGEIYRNSQAGLQVGRIDLLAFGVTLVLALLALPLGSSLIRRAGLLPFVIYRLLFGALLIGLGVV